MAGTNDEDMDSLLSNFDQIFEDFKDGITMIDSLKSSYNNEINRREYLQTTCNDLKQDNERLMKLYTDSLNKLANQIEGRSKCQSLKEELKKANAEHSKKQEEQNRAIDVLKQKHTQMVGDLKAQIRCFQLQQVENEKTIDQLRGDLATHKSHVETLSRRLERVHSELQSKHQLEFRDLKDWLLVEQEEKCELNKKLQSVETELENSRKTLQEQQRDSTSNRHVETLKQKIMKLRKENEVLKRELNNIKDR